MDRVFQVLWGMLNDAFVFTFTGPSIQPLLWFGILHVILAMATLGHGDRTLCDILKPILRIFNPDKEALLSGSIEVVVGIPRAIVYYGSLYIRAYLLAIRVLLFAWIAAILGLLAPLVSSIFLGLIYGFGSKAADHDASYQLAILTFYPASCYCYWRLDGRRLLANFKRAIQC